MASPPTSSPPACHTRQTPPKLAGYRSGPDAVSQPGQHADGSCCVPGEEYPLPRPASHQIDLPTCQLRDVRTELVGALYTHRRAFE